MTSQYPILDSSNTTAYLFINNHCKDKKQLDLLKLYKEEIEAAKIVVDENYFSTIMPFINKNTRKGDYCVPFVDEKYVSDQLKTDSCVIVLATNHLITKERIDVNAIVYSFALLQLDLEPADQQNVYIDVICSYKANEPDKNKKPMGAGKLLITHIRNMTRVMGIKYISLSSVENAKGAYEKLGFKFEAINTATNEQVWISFLNKTPEEIQAILNDDDVVLQKVPDVVKNGVTTYLYKMVREVTPNNSHEKILVSNKRFKTSNGQATSVSSIFHNTSHKKGGTRKTKKRRYSKNKKSKKRQNSCSQTVFFRGKKI